MTEFKDDDKTTVNNKLGDNDEDKTAPVIGDQFDKYKTEEIPVPKELLPGQQHQHQHQHQEHVHHHNQHRGRREPSHQHQRHRSQYQAVYPSTSSGKGTNGFLIAALVLGSVVLLGFGGCALVFGRPLLDGLNDGFKSGGGSSDHHHTYNDNRSATASTPKRVTIKFYGALIALSKVGGAKWDGPGKIPDEDRAEISRLLATAPSQVSAYGQILVIMEPYMTGAWEAPDPYGTVTLMQGGQTVQSFDLDILQDTYRPQWPSHPTFEDVVLTDDTKLEVHLDDDDSRGGLGTFDTIDNVVIQASQLRKALVAGDNYHCPVNVNDRNAQLLYVDIGVFAITPR